MLIVDCTIQHTLRHSHNYTGRRINNVILAISTIPKVVHKFKSLMGELVKIFVCIRRC